MTKRVSVGAASMASVPETQEQIVKEASIPRMSAGDLMMLNGAGARYAYAAENSTSFQVDDLFQGRLYD